MILKELKTILDAWKFVEKLKNDNKKKVKKKLYTVISLYIKKHTFLLLFVITAILNGCIFSKTRVQFQKKKTLLNNYDPSECI